MNSKRVPMRRCVGCGISFEKSGMIRIRKDAAGRIYIDHEMNGAGRSAYICNKKECLEAAVKKKGLERSFRSAVPKEVYDSLREEFLSK